MGKYILLAFIFLQFLQYSFSAQYDLADDLPPQIKLCKPEENFCWSDAVKNCETGTAWERLVEGATEYFQIYGQRNGQCIAYFEKRSNAIVREINIYERNSEIHTKIPMEYKDRQIKPFVDNYFGPEMPQVRQDSIILPIILAIIIPVTVIWFMTNKPPQSLAGNTKPYQPNIIPNPVGPFRNWHKELASAKPGNEWNQIYTEYRASPEWKKRRETTLKNASYKCQCCKEKQVKCCTSCEKKATMAHHLTYDRVGAENVDTDLLAVCKDCHKKIEYLKTLK